MRNIDFSTLVLYARCCDYIYSAVIKIVIIKTIFNEKKIPTRISTVLLRNNKIYEPTKITPQ